MESKSQNGLLFGLAVSFLLHAVFFGVVIACSGQPRPKVIYRLKIIDLGTMVIRSSRQAVGIVQLEEF